jgi:hypothetical protein
MFMTAIGVMAIGTTIGMEIIGVTTITMDQTGVGDGTAIMALAYT